MAAKSPRLGNHDTVTAQQYNRLVQEVERLSRLTVLPPLLLTNTGAGVNLAVTEQGFWATILPQSSTSLTTPAGICGPQSWEEIQPVGDGTFTVLDQGRSGGPTGSPAYEVNGNCVSAGTNVWLWPGLNGEYYFDVCCAADNSPLSTSSTSGSLSISTSRSGSITGYCIPFVQYASCEDGSLQVTQKYLNITLPAGATLEVSDTPCNGSGS